MIESRICRGFVSILLIYGMLSALNSSSATQHELFKPNADLKPQQVVKIVLDALAKNDTPYANAGIETTYNFASPGNKVNTGPLKRFIGMLNSPAFVAMIDHQVSEISDVVVEGDKAFLLVLLVSKEGQEIRYAFQLGLQQEGDYKDMWMTEAVWPLKDSGNIGA